MNSPPRQLSKTLAPVLAAIFLSSSAQANDELFIGNGNTEIYKSDTSGHPEMWTSLGATPQALLFYGDDLLVGTATGSILRLNNKTGELLASFETGLPLVDMAIHDGRLLVAAADNLVHLLNPTTGSSLGALHPTFPVSTIEVEGDRLFVGSTDGHIEVASIEQDNWTTVLSSAPGAVTDIAFGGEVMYFTSTNSASVFIVTNEDAQNIREYVVLQPPTSLAVTGNSILVGTSLGGIYDYDVPSFATNSLTWVYTPITSLTVNHQQSTGTGYCGGDICPCGNTSAIGGCANSTGFGAELEATGNSNISLGDVDLGVRNLPANSFAVLFMSRGNLSTGFGDGRLCVVGQPVFRYPTQSTGPAGWIEERAIAQHSLDHFGAAGQIHGGATWNFQAWYRNVQGPCGSGFNTSNAWTVSFTE